MEAIEYDATLLHTFKTTVDASLYALFEGHPDVVSRSQAYAVNPNMPTYVSRLRVGKRDLILMVKLFPAIDRTNAKENMRADRWEYASEATIIQLSAIPEWEPMTTIKVYPGQMRWVLANAFRSALSEPEFRHYLSERQRQLSEDPEDIQTRAPIE